MTLLEMLVALALLAVVLGWSGFGFREWLPGMHLRGAVNDLVIDLQYARLRAIAQNRYYRLVFSTEKNTYHIERESGKGQSRWPGVADGLQREWGQAANPYYHPEVELVQVSQNPVFSPRGGAFGTTIKLQSGGRLKVITVSSQGRVKVE